MIQTLCVKYILLMVEQLIYLPGEGATMHVTVQSATACSQWRWRNVKRSIRKLYTMRLR